MKRNKMLLFFVLLCVCVNCSSCWNYREIEQLAVASCVALDKNEDGSLNLTIEVVDITGDGQVTYEPKYIEIAGKTFFEAARKAIAAEGERIYWSHAKAVIISQDIAKEDAVEYLDFLFRDAGTREDIWLLLSMEKTAKEILYSKGVLHPIVGFQIDDTMRSQESVSRFPFIEMFEFFDRLFYKEVSPVLPIVRLAEQKGGKTPQIGGTAIFKDRKLIGTLDESHTRCMLWLRDEVKGGLIVVKSPADTGDDVTLEIFKSNSKITPVMQNNRLKMKVDIELDVSIGEIIGTTDYISAEGRRKLIEASKKQIEKEVRGMYSMVRDKYNADVLGFGRRIEMEMPYVWNQIKNRWDEYFRELELDLNIDMKIRGSATTRKPLKSEN